MNIGAIIYFASVFAAFFLLVYLIDRYWPVDEYGIDEDG